MSDATDDPKLLALWAAGLEANQDYEASAEQRRARLLASLDRERYLPFCAELARHVDLPEDALRKLLALSASDSAWTRAAPPVWGYIDFDPGPGRAPLRAGFVRLLGGARLPRHEHLDRELTFVLEGLLIEVHTADGPEQHGAASERSYGPGSVIDMPVGSTHALRVPEAGSATVVLLHGRVRSL
jgi:quercetin dioxygenase-like cupin family protein